jgi:hypothetical protein
LKERLKQLKIAPFRMNMRICSEMVRNKYDSKQATMEFSLKANSMDHEMSKRRHYFFMAAIMVLIDLVINIRFNTANGWVLFMACFFGTLAGIFFYAAIRTK